MESVQTASKNDAAAAVHVKFTSVRVKIMWKAKVKGQRPVISMCDCLHVDMKRAYRKNGACMFPKIGLRSNLRVYNFKKFSWQEHAPVPLPDACYACTECAYAVPT